MLFQKFRRHLSCDLLEQAAEMVGIVEAQQVRRGYDLFPWLPVLAGEIVRSQMRTNFGLSELTVGGQCKDMQKILG